MAESAAALEDLDASVAVDGVDGIYVGPGTCRCPWAASSTWMTLYSTGPCSASGRACAAAGKPVGVHASDGATARP